MSGVGDGHILSHYNAGNMYWDHYWNILSTFVEEEHLKLGGGCHGGGCCGGGCSDNNDTGVADNDDSTKDNVYNKGEIQDP